MRRWKCTGFLTRGRVNLMCRPRLSWWQPISPIDYRASNKKTLVFRNQLTSSKNLPNSIFSDLITYIQTIKFIHNIAISHLLLFFYLADKENKILYYQQQPFYLRTSPCELPNFIPTDSFLGSISPLSIFPTIA